MEKRKWEDLETDCLVNVLRRVGMESLLLDVPFVCKSWHKASLSPLCWKNLVFPKLEYHPLFYDSFIHSFMKEYGIKRFSVTSFIKLIVDRSCRNASVAIFPGRCTEEALKYVADKCPDLKTIGIPASLYYNQLLIIRDLIPKLKNLEGLHIGSSCNLKEIIVEISFNCKNIASLHVERADIERDEALAIVTLLPKIKELFLMEASIDRENLVTILKGCKDLVHLDVSKCIGFEADEMILELASHIKTFKHEGSRLCNDDDYYKIFDLDMYGGYF